METLKEKTHKYSCGVCDLFTSNHNDYTRHLTTAKHTRAVNGDGEETRSLTEKTHKYSCDLCDFFTGNHNDYTRHLTTEKHKNRVNGNVVSIKNADGYQCGCGKLYAMSGSLWRHKKKCSQKPDNISDGISYSIQEDTSQTLTMDMFMEIMKQNNAQQTLSMNTFVEIMKQNKEVQNVLIEQNNKLMEKITELVAVPQNTMANSNNTNSNNTNNNSFNLNVFLNEHCKDAINMSEFIKSLAITSADLERTGKVGFVKGMSEIFINGLKQLDVNKRPIHCTDVKRESIYMKDEDKWEKDDKSRFHQAIQRLTVKNIKQLRNWEIENPEFSNVESETYDKYFQITKNIMGGIGEDDKKFKDKIVSNVIHTVKIPQ